MSYKVTIGDIKEHPVLVSMHQGLPQIGKPIEVECTTKKVGKKRKTMVTCKSGSVQYKGTDFGDQGNRLNSMNYAVGIVDEKTKEIRIIPVDHVFILSPQLEQTPVTSTVAKSSVSSYEKKQSLAEAFGSRKKQRAVKAAQSNIISVENIAGATAIQQALQGGAGGGDTAAEAME